MKVTIATVPLIDLITKTEKVTSKKTALSVLGNIYFEVKSDSLLIRSTNLEVGVEGEINAKVEKAEKDNFSFVIAASLLKNFLLQVRSSQKVEIEIADNKATFKTKGAEAVVAIESAEDFPSLPEVDKNNDTTSLSLSAENFIEGVSSVFYAAATSTMKPELSSIYIHSYNNELYFVATDTFRLAEKIITSKGVGDNISILIPQHNALEITKIINQDEPLEMTFDQNLLEITQNRLRITARIVDGNFPDYRQIIPTEFSTEATVLFYDLENSLRLSSIFVDQYHQVTLGFEKDKITLNSKGSELGRSRAEIPATIEGEEISSRFNQRYLSDAMSSLKGDNATLKISANKPMVMTNVADNSFRYLVMPMHQ